LIKNLRNIGIFASVDMGKTTLTEHMLYLGGTIPQPGSVDHGTAKTDSMDVERARGISVRAALANLTWCGCPVNIIDTPGHVDFNTQVAKALWALDGAVLVLSACDEINAYSKSIFDALRKNSIPTLIFINKTDRPTADISKTIASAKSTLSDKVLSISPKLFNASADNYPDADYEALAELDESILAKYLAEDSITYSDALKSITKNTRECGIYPVISGSALSGESVDILLDCVTKLLPPPGGDTKSEAEGIVFALNYDIKMGKGAVVKMYGGTIGVRDMIEIGGAAHKITQITKLSGLKHENCTELSAGEMGTFYGMSDAKVSDYFGTNKKLMVIATELSLQTPLLSADISIDDESRLPELKSALDILTDEDPALNTKWSSQSKSFSIDVMGNIQLEILANEFENRFTLPAKIAPPKIIYKETPSRKGIGYERYTMPKPCWAVIKFEITPLPTGSGVVYTNHVVNEQISHRYLKQIESTLPRALKQGLRGWEVTDLHIALVDGEDHNMHTHPLDFVVATPMALMNGLQSTGVDLLEPILETEIIVPSELSGKVMSDITLMRGEFTPETAGEMVKIRALIPAAESWDYSIKLASLTGGRAMMTARLKEYRKCPPGMGDSAPRRSVNPLDRAKYILAARSALNGDIFS
jgi:ribosomal protection tetracycline resistance protein